MIEPGGKILYFTICSKNYLPRAISLGVSLRFANKDSEFLIFLVDTEITEDERSLVDFPVINVNEIGIKDFKTLAKNLSITELNTALKPSCFLFLFQNRNPSGVIYLDPDCLVYSEMIEIETAFKLGYDAILTPHSLRPYSIGDFRNENLLRFGAYNLGFLGFANTKEALDFLEWFSLTLLNECTIAPDRGLFVDQKWADLIPSFLPKTHVIRHAGYNVAYWNIEQRLLSSTFGEFFAEGEPLRFIHFSGFQIGSPLVSRHNPNLLRNQFKVFQVLASEYEHTLKLCHQAKFEDAVYPFSWNGKSLENLHTPYLTPTTINPDLTPTTTNPAKSRPREFLGKIRHLFSKRRLISLRNLIRAAKALRRHGLKVIPMGISYIRGVEDIEKPSQPETAKDFAPSSFLTKGILWIDVKIPTDDSDGGSLGTSNTIRHLAKNGFEVHFIPQNLDRIEPYASHLEGANIRVHAMPELSSVSDWLRNHAQKFRHIVISRAPIANEFIDLVKATSPLSLLYFNTVDLHHVREMREATLLGNHSAIESAFETEKVETRLATVADLTIVISQSEKEIIEAKAPSSRAEVIPLSFESDAVIRSDQSSKIVTFLGSFSHTPNFDAVNWFVSEIWPIILASEPEAKLKIVGSDPSGTLAASLSAAQDILYCGWVPDLEPIFLETAVWIAPLRYGAGTKVKIGIAMGKGVPVVTTSVGAEGMGIIDGQSALIADFPEDFASAVLKLLGDGELRAKIAKNAREIFDANYSMEVVGNIILEVFKTLSPPENTVPSEVECENWQDFETEMGNFGFPRLTRLMAEQALTPVGTDEPFSIEAFCSICKKQSDFVTSYMFSSDRYPNGSRRPNWREHLQCSSCNLITRQRQLLEVFRTYCEPSASDQIYITEKVTPFYKYLAVEYPGLVGSEYLGPLVNPGESREGVRNENLEALSFNEKVFDFVLSLDVLEHVQDYHASLQEFFRVLKKGGTVVFTAPFRFNEDKNETRALMVKGKRVDFYEPEFHGNPINLEEGSFTWRYLGTQILKDLIDVGFKNPKMHISWSPKTAYLGDVNVVVTATK
jgi:glycosyltransferase involved in cell wall biosynthesis